VRVIHGRTDRIAFGQGAVAAAITRLPVTPQRLREILNRAG
jgi:hypothetical protein